MWQCAKPEMAGKFGRVPGPSAVGPGTLAGAAPLECGARPDPVWLGPGTVVGSLSLEFTAPNLPRPAAAMLSSRNMVRILLSVDTELWPVGDASVLPEAILRHVHGRTPNGDFGLGFQARLLRDRGLAATFFVEPLHALVTGQSALIDMVSMLLGEGQDVQAHAHPEWLGTASSPELRALHASNIADLPEAAQVDLLARVRALLAAAGARDVRAFRAGNFGASSATLRALARTGFLVDSSYNEVYVGSSCRIESEAPLRDAARLEGVLEVPVGCFRDAFGRMRPLQICAVSFEEMRDALLAARDSRRETLSILWHGGELIGRSLPGHDPRRRLYVRRFERLLDFLADNEASFPVVSFARLAQDPPRLPASAGSVKPVRSRHRSTVVRYAEQAVSRWF